MSRYIEKNPSGGYTTTIADMDECKHLYNEVCCLDLCDMCADYPATEYCEKRCPYFEKEDGVVQ